MELYLLRHAIAVERGTAGYADPKRPLTPEGIQKMKRIARGIKKLKIDFDLILSSPYRRAKETAQILVDELNVKKKLKFSDQLIPEGSFKKLALELKAFFEVYENIVLVGHEPFLSQFMSKLITGKNDFTVELKKGGLAKLTLDKIAFGSGDVIINWLLTPYQLMLIR